MLEGSNFEDLMRTQGPLPERVGVLVAIRVLSALQAAHEMSVVHRDIKPANLFLCSDGRVVVLDFGLARATSEQSGATLAQGLNTQLIGTPAFLAPEQVAGAALSPKSDLFSLGSTLFALLTGREPYKRDGILATLQAIASDDRRIIGDVAPGLSAEVVVAVEHLMAFEPQERPADARAARHEFEAAAKKLGATASQLVDFASPFAAGTSIGDPSVARTAAGETQVGSAPSEDHTSIRTTPARDATKRRRLPAVAGATAALVITAVGLGAWYELRAPARPPQNVVAPTQVDLAPLPPPGVPEAPPTAPAAAPDVPVVPDLPAARAAEPPKGRIKCTFAQWADVSIDGQPQGKKQFSATFALAAGKHVLTFSHPKYGERTATFAVRAGKETPCEVDFLE